METINTEQLISLVEERPALWDKTLELYKNKHLKDSAWREICVILKEGFEEMEQKQRQEFGKLVLKKWTQTRDSWMKAIKKQKDQKASGASAKSSRLHIYHEQMSFLRKITNLSVAHESTDNANVRGASTDLTDEVGTAVVQGRRAEDNANAGDHESPSQSVSKPSLLEQRKRKFSIRNEVDAKMLKFIDHQMNVPNKEQQDRHTAFFKGILPSLSLLNDDQTLEFQAGVIKLLQDIKSKASSPVNPLPTQGQKDNWYDQEWLRRTSAPPVYPPVPPPSAPPVYPPVPPSSAPPVYPPVPPPSQKRQQDLWNGQKWQNHAYFSQQIMNSTDASTSNTLPLTNTTVVTPRQSPDSPESLESVSTQNSEYSYSPNFSQL